MWANIFVRLISVALLAFGGWALGTFLASQRPSGDYLLWTVSLAAGGGVIGLLIGHYVVTVPLRWVRREVAQVPIHIIFAAILGLVTGLIVSALLALPLSMLPGLFGTFLPLGVSLLLSYIGVAIMVMRARDIFQVFTSALPASGVGTPWREMPPGEQVLLEPNNDKP